MKIYIYNGLDKSGKKKHQVIEISEAEADQWVQVDYERRQAESDVPVSPRTAQEIMEEASREYINSDRKAFNNTRLFDVRSNEEGEAYNEMDSLVSADLSPEQEFILEETHKEIEKGLTEIQLRRYKLYREGVSIRQIALDEGINYKTVYESIHVVKKFLKKFNN